MGARQVVSPPASSMTVATPRLPHAAQAEHNTAHRGAAGFPLGKGEMGKGKGKL